MFAGRPGPLLVRTLAVGGWAGPIREGVAEAKAAGVGIAKAGLPFGCTLEP